MMDLCFSKRIKATISCTVLLIPSILQGQGNDTGKADIPQNPYIETMSRYLAVRLSMNNDIKNFVVRNSTKYEIRANDKTVFKLSLNYRWLSGAFSFTPTFIPGNNDNALKGKTKSASFSLGFNFKHWLQDFSYTRVKGYYLNNTGDYDPGWRKGIDPYIQFPDLVFSSYKGRTAYKFNRHFSFNALSTQTERQLRSAGTFMPELGYEYYIVDDRTQLTGMNSSQKSNNLELLISAGYYHTFLIYGKFYFSAGLVPGIGFISTKLLTRLPSQNTTTHYTNAVYRIEGLSALGYNSERFFAGGQLVASAVGYNQAKTSNVVVSNRVVFQVFAGYRLKAPQVLKTMLDRIESKGYFLAKKKK